jgi:hypothetical protein
MKKFVANMSSLMMEAVRTSEMSILTPVLDYFSLLHLTIYIYIS